MPRQTMDDLRRELDEVNTMLARERSAHETARAELVRLRTFMSFLQSLLEQAQSPAFTPPVDNSDPT